MINKLKHLTQSRFIRNVAIVITGTASAQAITMAFAPIITRLYGPESFGILGIFLALLALVTPIAALTYPVAIVLPKSDCDAKGVAKLSARLAIGIACLVTAVLLLIREGLAELLMLEQISIFLLLIPLAMVFSAFQQILQQWLIRKNKFGVTAKAAMIQALVLNTTSVGIGLFYPLDWVLIVLATLSNALYTYLLFLGINSRPKHYLSKLKILNNKQGVSEPCNITVLALHYREFPIYRAPQDAINALSQSLPILMLASFFGPTAAGLYTLGKTVMGVPSTLIGKSVSDVFYPHITEAAHNKENLFALILKTTLALCVFGFIPFIIVIISGPWLFSFIFGSEWIITGEYARWLALLFFFNFINKPCVAAIPVLGIQRGLLFYEIFSTGAKALGLFAGFYWFNSALWAVALFSIIGAFAYCALIFWVFLCSIRWNKNAKTS